MGARYGVNERATRLLVTEAPSGRRALIPNLLDGGETSPTTVTPGLLKLSEPNPYSNKLH